MVTFTWGCEAWSWPRNRSMCSIHSACKALHPPWFVPPHATSISCSTGGLPSSLGLVTSMLVASSLTGGRMALEEDATSAWPTGGGLAAIGKQEPRSIKYCTSGSSTCTIGTCAAGQLGSDAGLWSCGWTRVNFPSACITCFQVLWNHARSSLVVIPAASQYRSRNLVHVPCTVRRE